MAKNKSKNERQNWREFKQDIKKKKTDALISRLDRELERKEQEALEKEKIEKQKQIQKEIENVKKPKELNCEEEEVSKENDLDQEEEEENEEIVEEDDDNEGIDETKSQDASNLNDQNDLEEENDDKETKKDRKRKAMIDKLREKFDELDQKKPKKKKKKPTTECEEDEEQNGNKKLPKKTVSIALPASIILNAQTAELRAYLIGQIARSAAIFNCYEIVVYDEYCTGGDYSQEDIDDPKIESMRMMTRVLQYLECPQYLRKSLFPLHKDFRFAGVINPLDARHHLRFEDESEFREGVVNANKNGKSFVYIGLKKEALVNEEVEPGTRVTVQLDIFEEKNYYNGKIVSPNAPIERLKSYWGYEVRTAKSLSTVLSECPFGKYDLVIGTSDKGDMIEEKMNQIPSFNHALVVFGGLKGIESAIESDIEYKDIKDARKIFDFYLNTCPSQGTNTIRTEEAILITLANLRSKLFS